MTPGRESPVGPLRLRDFRLLWTAGLAINLALWMQSVGASWLMLSMAPTPLMVALIQTAQSLPAFLFGLPGGVLADLVDRRALILVVCTSLCAFAAVAGLATFTGNMTPALLFLVTAGIGGAFALQAPATHTSLAEAVPREMLFAALALSAISFNVARAVGPALAGAVVSLAGVAVVFGLCFALFIFALLSVFRWRHRARRSDLPPERVLVGVRGSLQYARHSPVMRAQLFRTLLFVGAASGLWALLPIIARDRLALGADGYGFLLGCLGAGAVVGAAVAVHLRRRFTMNIVGIASAAIYMLGVAVAAVATAPTMVSIALGFAGAGWAVVGNVNLTAIQTAIPPWVRARAMALYLLVFQGAMALGGALWGTVATHWTLETALLASVVALLLTILVMRALPARIGELAETTPSDVAGLPALGVTPDEQDGPIAVQVDYRVRAQDREQFLSVMQVLGRSRKRDGAMFWRVYRDLGDPERFAERFVVRSWTDYLRQRSRATEADRQVEQRAWNLHVGHDAPQMQHMLAERMPGEAR